MIFQYSYGVYLVDFATIRLTPRLSCGARAPQRLRPRPPARRQLQPVVRQNAKPFIALPQRLERIAPSPQRTRLSLPRLRPRSPACRLHKTPAAPSQFAADRGRRATPQPREHLRSERAHGSGIAAPGAARPPHASADFREMGPV